MKKEIMIKDGDYLEIIFQSKDGAEQTITASYSEICLCKSCIYVELGRKNINPNYNKDFWE